MDQKQQRAPQKIDSFITSPKSKVQSRLSSLMRFIKNKTLETLKFQINQDDFLEPPVDKGNAFNRYHLQSQEDWIDAPKIGPRQGKNRAAAKIQKLQSFL